MTAKQTVVIDDNGRVYRLPSRSTIRSSTLPTSTSASMAPGALSKSSTCHPAHR